MMAAACGAVILVVTAGALCRNKRTFCTVLDSSIAEKAKNDVRWKIERGGGGG